MTEKPRHDRLRQSQQQRCPQERHADPRTLLPHREHPRHILCRQPRHHLPLLAPSPRQPRPHRRAVQRLHPTRLRIRIHRQNPNPPPRGIDAGIAPGAAEGGLDGAGGVYLDWGGREQADGPGGSEGGAAGDGGLDRAGFANPLSHKLLHERDHERAGGEVGPFEGGGDREVDHEAASARGEIPCFGWYQTPRKTLQTLVRRARIAVLRALCRDGSGGRLRQNEGAAIRKNEDGRRAHPVRGGGQEAGDGDGREQIAEFPGDLREDAGLRLLRCEAERIRVRLRLAGDGPFEIEGVEEEVGPEVDGGVGGWRDDDEAAGIDEGAEAGPGILGDEVGLGEEEGIEGGECRGVDGSRLEVADGDGRALAGLEGEAEPVGGGESFGADGPGEAAGGNDADLEGIDDADGSAEGVVGVEVVAVDLGDEHGLGRAGGEGVVGGADDLDGEGGTGFGLAGGPADGGAGFLREGGGLAIGRGGDEADPDGGDGFLGDARAGASEVDADGDWLGGAAASGEDDGALGIDAGDGDVGAGGGAWLGGEEADAVEVGEDAGEWTAGVGGAGEEVAEEDDDGFACGIGLGDGAESCAEGIERAGDVGAGLGGLEVSDELADGAEVGRGGDDDGVRGCAERDEPGAVALAHGTEDAVGLFLGAVEGGGVAGAEGCGEGVVDEEVDIASGAGEERAGGIDEGAGDGGGEEQDDEAARGEEDPLLDAESAALAAEGLHQEAHGGPGDGLAALAHEEMDEDGDGDGRDARDEDGWVEEGHGVGLSLWSGAFGLRVAPGEEGGEGWAEPVVGVDASVIEAEGARGFLDGIAVGVEGLEVFLSDGARVEAESALAFESFEGGGLVEVELGLALVDDLEEDGIVGAVSDAGKGGADLFGILEEIADEDDEAAVVEFGEHLIDDASEVGGLVDGVGGECGDDASPLALRGGAGGHREDLIGVDGEADAVALTDGDEGECGGGCGGVVELGPVGAAVVGALCAGAGGGGVGAGAEVHGAGGIDEEDEVEVGLLLVLLEVEAFGASEDLPVEVSEVVAGDIGAVLGELDGESEVWGAVHAAHDALDDHAGAEFEGFEA